MGACSIVLVDKTVRNDTQSLESLFVECLLRYRESRQSADDDYTFDSEQKKSE